MANKYKINIDGKWTLEDLYVFPHTFSQVYYLMYSLSPNQPDTAVERIMHAYEAFPWRGGYSAVNFYNQLKYAVPLRERPTVSSIRYASPGFLELSLMISVALNVKTLVKLVAGSLKEFNSTYHKIHTDLQKRKLLRLDVKLKELKLKRAELALVEKSTKQMANLMGIKNVKEITARTGHPFITLKILLSLYRRIRKLAEYETKGKTKL